MRGDELDYSGLGELEQVKSKLVGMVCRVIQGQLGRRLAVK